MFLFGHTLKMIWKTYAQDSIAYTLGIFHLSLLYDKLLHYHQALLPADICSKMADFPLVLN